MSTHSTVSRRRRAIARNAARHERRDQSVTNAETGAEQDQRDVGEHFRDHTAPASAHEDVQPNSPANVIHTTTLNSVDEDDVDQLTLRSPERVRAAAALAMQQPPFSASDGATHIDDASHPAPAPSSTKRFDGDDGADGADGADGEDGDAVSTPRRQAMEAYQAQIAATSHRLPAYRFHDDLSTRSPFTWRERDWRNSRWSYWLRLLPAVAALVVVLLVAGTLAYIFAIKAASAANSRLTSVSPRTASTPGAGLIVQPAPASTTPTPPAVEYQLGLWVSNSTVFVRVTHEVAPVPGAPVSLTVNGFPYGPVVTDTDGLARFNVSFGGASETNPAYLKASCSIAGQGLTTDMDYIPSAGGPAVAAGTPAVPPVPAFP